MAAASEGRGGGGGRRKEKPSACPRSPEDEREEWLPQDGARSLLRRPLRRRGGSQDRARGPPKGAGCFLRLEAPDMRPPRGARA